MSEPGRIDFERREHVAHITLNNPARRNAMGYAMWQQLGDGLEALSSEPALRVVVLAGAGEQAFCAGADIKEFEQWRSEPAQAAEYDATANRATRALAALPMPVVARIRGACVGGGFELALLCDIRLCSQEARFAVTPARLGLGYSLHDTELLVDRLGAPATREILFTGRSYDAHEALRLGIVSEVHAADALDDAVAQCATRIAGNAPLTVRASKAIIAEAAKPPAARDAALCQSLVDACYASRDFAEGRRAFVEKRTPQFEGR